MGLLSWKGADTHTLMLHSHSDGKRPPPSLIAILLYEMKMTWPFFTNGIIHDFLKQILFVSNCIKMFNPKWKPSTVCRQPGGTSPSLVLRSNDCWCIDKSLWNSAERYLSTPSWIRTDLCQAHHHFSRLQPEGVQAHGGSAQCNRRPTSKTWILTSRMV